MKAYKAKRGRGPTIMITQKEDEMERGGSCHARTYRAAASKQKQKGSAETESSPRAHGAHADGAEGQMSSASCRWFRSMPSRTVPSVTAVALISCKPRTVSGSVSSDRQAEIQRKRAKAVYIDRGRKGGEARRDTHNDRCGERIKPARLGRVLFRDVAELLAEI